MTKRKPKDPGRGDPLAEYHRKRDFGKTPEPAGGGPADGEGWSYLIQKHAARRLHYDLRLELDGVLKSWAVPKGPSLDPGEKHLAVRVEDHPLEYGGFEGIIPEGEYGGGTVLLWDRGTWRPKEGGAKEARAALARGRLHFRLDGEKLGGLWHLVRMHGDASDGGKNWLLIKDDDEAAERDGDGVTERRPESVASGRDLDEIAADPRRQWSSDDGESAVPPRPGGGGLPAPPDPAGLDGARRGPALGDFVPTIELPQLATRVDEPPAGDSWLHEIKHDGYRVLAAVDRRGDRGEARLVTRGGEDWTAKFPPLSTALAELPVETALLDGEAVAVAPDGASDFSRLQKALSEKRFDEMALYLFDLLYLDGWDLTAAPLEARKEALEALLAAAGLLPEDGGDGGTLRYSDHVTGRGSDVFQHACRLRLEGVVSKHKGRPYRPGRGRDWVKSKCAERQEMVIGGWVESDKRSGFRSIVVGVYPPTGEAETLVYAGRVGTGFDDTDLRELAERFAELERDESPFADPRAARGGVAARLVHWVEPELVCEVEFTEWTADGRLRHPSYQGLRGDKRPRDVVREAPVTGGGPEPPPEDEKEARTSRRAAPKATRPRGAKAGKEKDVVEIAGIRISHPDRVVYPEQGLTKAEVAAYYEAVAEHILPHLHDRPLSLVRCPEGRTGCFYQKHVDRTFPAAVRRVEIEEKDGEASTYAMANDAGGLVALVQMGVLEIHPWGARRDRLDRPDLLTFDLDPDAGLPWGRVAEAAHVLHDFLDHLGLESFVKTTGGKGLHVVVPLERRSGWDEAKAFSRQVAETLAEAAPDRFLAQASKAKRKGKVFVDWLRNARGATSVAAYSTRARPGAPVSMPIAWDEVDGADPAGWTVETAPAAIAGRGADPWAAMAGLRQSITAAARRRLDERRRRS
jgi:bifunctional non-homologous end joining protein LigD